MANHNYLSREEDLRRLNEALENELKKATKFPIALGSQRHSPSLKNERFATYTKNKTPIATTTNGSRKNGAGDFVSPPKTPTITKATTTKEHYNSGFNQRLAKFLPKHVEMKVNNEIEKKTLMPRQSNFNGQTKSSIKSPEKIIVKYKNDKFSSSISLDNMIKDDLHTLAKSNKVENGELISDSQEFIVRHDRGQPAESLVFGGKKFLNTNTLIRFLKSKVSVLEENQAQNMQEMNQQKELYDQAIERHKLVQQQRDKAVSKINDLNEQLEKINTQLSESNSRYRHQMQESIVQQKELESIRLDLKQLSLSNANLNKRYNRTKEELMNLQGLYSSHKENEFDFKKKLRHDLDTKDSEIKNLKKQRLDLFKAYKKQMYVIDNLKQQNICLEQAKMLDFSENDFSKVLEWNSKC